MSVKELALHPKVAATTAAATVGAGAALEWIPSDIGKLATLIGIILSVVLIYVTLHRWRIESAKHRLEIQVLELQKHRLELERENDEC